MLELVAVDENAPSPATADPDRPWKLRLYVAGQTVKSMFARANLQRICEEHLSDKYHIDVIDLLANPQLAKRDQIFALPTLVRDAPMPTRKIVGDLSNTERVLVGLDIYPDARHSPSPD